jgi:hypothetical protein
VSHRCDSNALQRCTAQPILSLFFQVGNLLKANFFDRGRLTGIFERLITNDTYDDVQIATQDTIHLLGRPIPLL